MSSLSARVTEVTGPHVCQPQQTSQTADMAHEGQSEGENVRERGRKRGRGETERKKERKGGRKERRKRKKEKEREGERGRERKRERKKEKERTGERKGKEKKKERGGRGKLQPSSGLNLELALCYLLHFALVKANRQDSQTHGLEK